MALHAESTRRWSLIGLSALAEKTGESPMTSRELEEYKALRATIRERGTARVWVFVVGLGLWGALAVTTASLLPLPVATVLPLVVLAGVFEAVFAIHTGVERIGRYIQIFYEDPKAEAGSWEHTAMALGATSRVRGPDPLFVASFTLATAV